MSHFIAIIGGGIIGFTIAEQLVQANAGSITLFDRDLVGQGASARSAGLHFPLGRSAQARDMAALSQQFYEAEIERDPSGPIRRLEMRVHLAAGTDISALDVFLDSTRLQGLSGPGPLVQGKNLRSWKASNAHHCQVTARLTQLVRRVSGRLILREGCVVEGIEETGTTVRVRLGDGTAQDFDRVILAPGPWACESPFMAFTAGLNIRIKKIVAFHIDAPAGSDDAAELFLSEDAFLLPVPSENRWIYSYTCDEWDISPATMSLGARDRAAAQAILRRYVPQWADRLNAGRVFCDAYNTSRTPLVSEVGDSGRIIFAGAANGSGYRLAPALAERVLHSLTPIN
ncbi:D-arginine dehydrogenase [Undibacterium sp. GrIS 1.2]